MCCAALRADRLAPGEVPPLRPLHEPAEPRVDLDPDDDGEQQGEAGDQAGAPVEHHSDEQAAEDGPSERAGVLHGPGPESPDGRLWGAHSAPVVSISGTGE